MPAVKIVFGNNCTLEDARRYENDDLGHSPHNFGNDDSHGRNIAFRCAIEVDRLRSAT
jgi:hypothetical protein